MTPQDLITYQKLQTVIGWIKAQKHLAEHADVPIPLRADFIDISDQVVQVAECFIGVSEDGDSNTGEWVNRALDAAGLDPGHPWCEALDQLIVQIVSEVNGLPDLLPFDTGSTKAMADWSINNGLCVDSYESAKPGDQLILRNGRSWKGHTQTILEVVNHRGMIWYQVIGGNESNTSWRDGGGTRVTVICPEEKYGIYQKSSTHRWCPAIRSTQKLLQRVN